MDVSGGGEFAAIDRLRRLFGEPAAGERWIGDDAAVLRPPGGSLLAATDVLVENVHFDLTIGGVDDVGWKAAVVNVSDVAAMGGLPTALLVAVAGPPGTDLDRLYEGLADAARAYDCPVVGGDLSDAPLLVVSVTVIGHAARLGPVLRSGARPGDAVFVTGPLGAAAAGLALLRAGREGGDAVAAYRRPRARLAEGRAAAGAGATAMIDVSDGLAADLGHLLVDSGVGAALDEVPVAPGATLEQALGGGDDYELLFTAPDPERVVLGFEAAGLRLPLRIGTCTADPAQRPAAAGWRHHWS